MLKKIFVGFLLVCLSLPLGAIPAAANNTILPAGDAELEEIFPCEIGTEYWNSFWSPMFEDFEAFKVAVEDSKEGEMDWFLSCAVKTGKIRFWMIPYFIRNILQFLINIAGILSVLMILVGAFFLIAGGATDDKEKGKNIITYALGGLVLTVLSWFIVNVVLLILTS